MGLAVKNAVNLVRSGKGLEQLCGNEQTNGTGLAGRPGDHTKAFEALHHLIDGGW